MKIISKTEMSVLLAATLRLDGLQMGTSQLKNTDLILKISVDATFYGMLAFCCHLSLQQMPRRFVESRNTIGMRALNGTFRSTARQYFACRIVY
jgi:hypothetical protein